MMKPVLKICFLIVLPIILSSCFKSPTPNASGATGSSGYTAPAGPFPTPAPVPETTYAGIYVLTPGPLTSYSIDSGTSWRHMLNPQGSANGTTAAPAGSFLAVSNGALYKTTGHSGSSAVLYTSDGVSWSPMATSFPSNDAAETVFAFGNAIYVGTSGGYVYSTTNNGTNWNLIASPSQLDTTPVTALFVNGSGSIFAGTNGVFGTSGGLVYVTTNNGRSWLEVGSGQPDGGEIWSLGVDATGTVYAATSNSGAFSGPLSYISDYSGTWSPIGTLSSASNRGLYALSMLGNTVYVGTGNGFILYSSDASSAGANWTQVSSQPAGLYIQSLLVQQGALSPAFVGTSGTVAVGGGQTSITVTNRSNATAFGVHAQLPSTVTGVTQTSSDCAMVVPQATCTLSLTAAQPYAPQNLAIVGAESSNAIDRIALAFSANGYLVYNVDSSTRTAYVVDSNDLTPAAWGRGFSSGDDIPGITENDIGVCDGATDGKCDTLQIVNEYPGARYAANLCYGSTAGGASPGTWYLPSACELNGSLYFDATTLSYASCSSVITGISSLNSVGLLSNLTMARYWSATEYSTLAMSSAWSQYFAADGGDIQSRTTKNSPSGVRCVKGTSY